MLNNNLNEDVLLEVLSRLPVKTLCCFKCVSKSWRDLIESKTLSKMTLSRLLDTKSNFNSKIIVASHSNPRSNNTFSIIDCNTKKIKEPNYPPLKSYKSGRYHIIDMVGSINGVICLRYPFRKIVIWNPLSQNYLETSCPTFIRPPNTKDCSEAYGFAYEKTTNDYKVVSLITSYNTSHLPIGYHGYIFSLKLKKWKKLENFTYFPKAHNGVLVSGALHWITRNALILSFNLADETFHLMPMPITGQTVLTGGMVEHLGVLGDCLTLTVKSDASKLYDIWVMNNYGVNDSWTRLNFGSKSFRKGKYFRPISYLKSNKQVIIQYSKGQYRLIHLDKDSVESIAVVQHVADYPYTYSKAYPYIETFECCDFTTDKTSRKRKRKGDKNEFRIHTMKST